jgi:hypothetical protein
MANEPDWNDPCAVATWLQPQLYAVAAGNAVVEVRSGDNRVGYSAGNYQALLSLYRDAVSQCARKNHSKVGRRRAFVGRIIRG